jgi:hypothetical protein
MYYPSPFFFKLNTHVFSCYNFNPRRLKIKKPDANRIVTGVPAKGHTEWRRERHRERARDDDEEDGHSSTTLRKNQSTLKMLVACWEVPTMKNRRDMSKGNQNGSKQTIISGR